MKTMINETPNEISTTNSRGNNKMKKFTKIFKNEKGLTLIELLAVIVILAIVAAIATPAIGNIINNSREKAILADASTILAGAKLAMIDGACGTTTPTVCESTEIGDYVEGLKTGATYSATKTGGAWSVTYSELKVAADWKMTPKPGVSGTVVGSVSITETALLTAMGK